MSDGLEPGSVDDLLQGLEQLALRENASTKTAAPSGMTACSANKVHLDVPSGRGGEASRNQVPRPVQAAGKRVGAADIEIVAQSSATHLQSTGGQAQVSSAEQAGAWGRRREPEWPARPCEGPSGDVSGGNGRSPGTCRTPASADPVGSRGRRRGGATPETQPFNQNSRERPATDTAVARRLIGAALGVRLPADKGADDALAAARRQQKAKRAERQRALDAAFEA
jgi:hypothetical protein